MEQGKYSFKITYDAKENLSIEVDDLVTSMSFFNKSILRICESIHSPDIKNKLKIYIHPFKDGSFITDYSLTTIDFQSPLFLTGLYTVITFGKEIFELLKTWIDIKVALKGEPITSIQPCGDNCVTVNGSNNKVTIINNQIVIKLINDKTLDNEFDQAQEILSKTSSNVDVIDITAQDIESFSIDKSQSKYFKKDELINKKEMKFNGIVSKIDKKVKSGYFELNGNRVPFKYNKLEPGKIDYLYQSLSNDTEITISCIAEIDYSGEYKNLDIRNIVEKPVRLFD